MSLYFCYCHIIAEGDCALAFAAAIAQRESNIGKKVALILTGANIDRADYARILSGENK